MKPSLKGLTSKRSIVTTRVFAFILGATLFAGASAFGQPGFSKSFTPDTIGPGSTSTLEFLIDNTPQFRGEAGPVDDLAFVDILPSGMVIADFAAATSTCDGTVVAPEGGGTITFSNGMVAENSTCTITVDVTGDFTTEGVVPEVLTNLTGDLTSDAGNSGTATADLTVDPELLGFSKAFSPSPVPLGGRSTLTFTIDNTANPDFEFLLTFTDNLPAGMVVAGPANTSNDCGGVVTAGPGASVVSLTGGGPVLSGAVCSVSVDVVANGGGELGNASGELTSTDNSVDFPSSGRANDILDVDFDALNLIKSFTDDPVPPETGVTLEFTITNFHRLDSATGITFTDDLSAVITGLVAVGLPASDVCGAGSTLSGTSLITLTGGNLPPEGSCTFSVNLDLPVGSVSGAYPNVTSAVSGDVGGSPTTGNVAADVLFVEPGPALTKEFLDDPVGGGGTVELEFSITNTSPTAAATDIAFTDTLDDIIVGATVPAVGFCGGGATMTFTPAGEFDPAFLTISGGDLAAAGSCTFSVDLDVIDGAPGGLYPNLTGAPTATVDAVTVTGPPASDDLEVVGGPSLLKEFTDDPVDPGATVTLEFTIFHDPDATADATSITFTDDLEAALTGLAAVGLPASDVCGVGSTLSGTSTLTFSGGTLAPGETCVFSATLDVPSDAPTGAHTNTTSDVSADVDGAAVIGNPASDDLMISGLDFTKEFIDDPTIPGDTVTLRFTIDNISPVSDATAIVFTDDLDETLSGLVATGLPMNDICGAGSSLTGMAGDTLLVLTSGNLLAGTSCTFDVTLDVPGGAANDTYLNTTSIITATMEGGPQFFDPAVDFLEVTDNLLQIEKEFTDDPVAPGDTVTLEFTVTNLDAGLSATAITFTDDLDAALSGLVATGLPANDVCGAGSQISGTDLLTLTGGSLAAAASCTFSITLQVPGSVAPGTVVTNVTSSVDGTIDGLPVSGDPATAELLINLYSFSKSFDGPGSASGTVELTFSIANDGSETALDLRFNDDLDLVIPGLVALGLPMADVCGAGSSLEGTSLVSLLDGTLLAGASCSIVVTLQLPSTAVPGTFLNETSTLREQGQPVADPATADLVVVDIAPPEVILVDSVQGTGDGELEECETAHSDITQLLVTFDEAMFDPGNSTDPNSVTNPDNWFLVGAGEDLDITSTICGVPADDDEEIVITGPIVYDGGSFTATLDVAGPLVDAPYQLFACSGGLIDVAGNALDGDGDGTGGDDFVRNFRVDEKDAFANGNFDCSLDDWTPSAIGGGGPDVLFSPDDVDDAGISGSAEFTVPTNAEGTTDLSLGQCVEVSGDSIYDYLGFARLNTAGATLEVVQSCDFFTSSDCSGSPTAAPPVLTQITTPDVWFKLVDELTTDPAADSALCQVTVSTNPSVPYSANVDNLSFNIVGTDVIFRDGFESGDLSAWSVAVP